MTKDAPHCCEGDDWLVVGSDDGSRGPAAGGSPRSKDSSEAHAGLEASQPPNQIEPQQAPLESDSNQKEQHQDRSLFQVSDVVGKDTFCLEWWLVDYICVSSIHSLYMYPSTHSSTFTLQMIEAPGVAQRTRSTRGAPGRESEAAGGGCQRQQLDGRSAEDAAGAGALCQRSDESEAWVPLAILADAEREDSCGAKLQLTSQIDLSAQMMWRQLLVECKFEAATCSDELTAWRHGRFFSYIQANAWRFELYLDQLVDALDTDKRWYESRIVDMDAVYVKVHYRGWTSKWDEWLRRTSARLAPLHTKVPNWRAFQVGDRVMVGTEIGKRYPEWRNAQVTACDSEGDLLQIEVDVDGKKKWMDSQDELLCPTGTHKAVNADARVVSAVLAAPPSLLFNYFERPGESASSVPRNDQSEGLELESIRQATHAMHLADSDGDGDEWCVVDDDRDEDSADAETNTDNNQTEGIVDEDDTTISEGSASCGVDPATSNSAPPTTNAAFSTLDQMFATTTEVLHGPIEATVGEEDTWRYQLQIDQLIDARDTDNVWYESRVVGLSSTLIKLHYRGWTSKWDEWIERTSTRIAPLHTKVRNWRDFKVGDAMMVGRQVATKKYPEWRNAVVTACEACEVDGRLRIEVDIDGSKKWMDAQDEMLCPPGTHKAVNSSLLKHMAPLF
ncbi:hypothetical protein ON010_g5174 [Phytophthora cinnamomi]|nr:hypothetical protein ON010_g5174 [Phytophthora cinnamomi]